ncbi:hypothetical protein CDAR_388021 [Caerostris darwini]|uniref:Uncharacterized protein n=1 Tax=Caerostris darwini TaxID=1538125 RepID=A0AAV4SUK7_9ARAC|nr:hypothetical protein CDAR_388021 [Caerostris darwini]
MFSISKYSFDESGRRRQKKCSAYQSIHLMVHSGRTRRTCYLLGVVIPMKKQQAAMKETAWLLLYLYTNEIFPTNLLKRRHRVLFNVSILAPFEREWERGALGDPLPKPSTPEIVRPVQHTQDNMKKGKICASWKLGL